MSGQLKGIVGWFKGQRPPQEESNQSPERQTVENMNHSIQQPNTEFRSLQEQVLDSESSYDDSNLKIDCSYHLFILIGIQRRSNYLQRNYVKKIEKCLKLGIPKRIVFSIKLFNTSIMIKKLDEQDLAHKELLNTNAELQKQLLSKNSNQNQQLLLKDGIEISNAIDYQKQIDQLKSELEVKDQQISQLRQQNEDLQNKSEIFQSCIQMDGNSILTQNLQENSTQTFQIADLSQISSSIKEISMRDMSAQTDQQNINSFSVVSPSKSDVNSSRVNSIRDISTQTVDQLINQVIAVSPTKSLINSSPTKQSTDKNQLATTRDTIKSQQTKEMQSSQNPFQERTNSNSDSFEKNNSILNVSTEEIDQEIKDHVEAPKLDEKFNSLIQQSTIQKIDQSNFTINPSLVNAMPSQIQDQNDKVYKQNTYILPENQIHNNNTQLKQQVQDNYSQYLKSGGQIIDQQQIKANVEQQSMIQQKQLQEALEKQSQILQQKQIKQKQLVQKSLDPYRNLFPKNEIFDVFNCEQIHEGYSVINQLKQTGLNLICKQVKVNPRYQSKFLQSIQLQDMDECEKQCKARLYQISEKTIYDSFEEKEIYYRHDYEAIRLFTDLCKMNKKPIFISFLVSSKTKFYFQDPEKRTLKLKSADQVYPLLIAHLKGI